MEVGTCPPQRALPGTFSVFPFLSWQFIKRWMHKYLRISKQQASSSGGRYQFGHQVNTPYQIKANIFDSTVIILVAILLLQVHWGKGWLILLTSVPNFKSGVHTYIQKMKKGSFADSKIKSSMGLLWLSGVFQTEERYTMVGRSKMPQNIEVSVMAGRAREMREMLENTAGNRHARLWGLCKGFWFLTFK